MNFKYSTGLTRAKKSILTLSFVLISLSSLAENNFLLITHYGTFTSCEDAAKFRDGKLFQMLDKAFEGANDVEKITRYNSTLDDFELHKNAAVAALKTATTEQRKDVMKTIAMTFAFHKLGKTSNFKKAFPNMSEAELKTVAHLTKRAAKVSQLAIESGFGDRSAMEKFVKNELLSNARFIADLAQISPQIKLFFTGAKLGIDVGFAYWDGEIKKTDAKNEIEVFDKAIKNLILKHPEMTLREINSVKEQIDEMCNN